MNFDYDTLRRLCSDELYNSYKSDLDVLKRKHNKNIMSDFKKQNFVVQSYQEDNNTISIGVYLSVMFYDYVIDEETGEVTRGSKNNLYKNIYYLEFIKNNSINDKCPNCGGKVENQKCLYCNSVVENGYSEYVLTNKRKMR